MTENMIVFDANGLNVSAYKIRKHEMFKVLCQVTEAYEQLPTDEQEEYFEAYIKFVGDATVYGRFHRESEVSGLMSILRTLDNCLATRGGLEEEVFIRDIAYSYLLALNFRNLTRIKDKIDFIGTGTYVAQLVQFLEENEIYDNSSHYIYVYILDLFGEVIADHQLSKEDPIVQMMISFLKKRVEHLFDWSRNNPRYYDDMLKSVLELNVAIGILIPEVLTSLNRQDFYDEFVQKAYLNLLGAIQGELVHNQELLRECLSVLLTITNDTSSDIIKRESRVLFEKLSEVLSEEATYLPQDSIVDESQTKTETELAYIESVVDDIRKELIVDDELVIKDLVLGHYTGSKTLIDFLIKENLKPSYLRLTHSRQLNDPMEGKALFDYLGIDTSILSEQKEYTRSNIYLSSMSTAKDSLPMWKEYGDGSKGVFLEYDSRFLNRLIENDIIEFAKVCYLSEENSKENPIFEKLDQLKDCLNGLKNQSRSEYVKAVTLLSRILYLFKVAEYSYEEEYRILINFDDTYVQKKVNRTNSEDKTQDIGLQAVPDNNYKDFRRYVHVTKGDGEIGLHVYINQEPLKYSNVVLGPKVERVDYIAPYLQLIDQDLTVELSQIPYR